MNPSPEAHRHSPESPSPQSAPPPLNENPDRYEAGHLRSSILEDFENRFPDVTDREATVFIEVLSTLNDPTQLTALREEFGDDMDASSPEDWIRVLFQEVPLEWLRDNEVIKAEAPDLLREVEGLPPLRRSLESVAAAHQEVLDQNRAAVLPQAERYCSLYFADVDPSVRDRALTNLTQLLVDGYQFMERVQHVSGGPIVMDFIQEKDGRHRFLYPDGEVQLRFPSRSGKSSETIPVSAETPPVLPENSPKVIQGPVIYCG